MLTPFAPGTWKKSSGSRNPAHGRRCRPCLGMCILMALILPHSALAGVPLFGYQETPQADIRLFKQWLDVLERHCEAEKRDPATIRRSMMVFAIVGPSEADLDASTRRVMGMFGAGRATTPAEFREGVRARGLIVGGREEVVEAVGRFAEMGVSELQFQHFTFESDDVPEYLAAEIVPRVR